MSGLRSEEICSSVRYMTFFAFGVEKVCACVDVCVIFIYMCVCEREVLWNGVKEEEPHNIDSFTSHF